MQKAKILKHILINLFLQSIEVYDGIFRTQLGWSARSLCCRSITSTCLLIKSATLILAYLMCKNKISFKAAINLLKAKRAGVCPNLGFEMQLKKY